MGRRGEIDALRWDDIDLVGGWLRIRGTGPDRQAHAQRRRYGGVDPKSRVFQHRNGRAVRPDWLTRRFATLVEELDLPPSRLHDLRHLAAGVAGAAGWT